MACDKTFTSVEDLLRHGAKFHGSIDFIKLSEDVQDIATNTFQLYMRGDEGRTYEKNIMPLYQCIKKKEIKIFAEWA